MAITSTAVAVAGMGLSAASAATQAAGAEAQGKANEQANNYQAQVADNNAQISRQNAAWTAQAGEQQAQQQGMKNRKIAGAIEAGQGANGLDINSGSNADVRSSADALGMLDSLTIRSNAAREAYGYQAQGSNFEAQAGLDRASGRYARQAGDIGAATSLLGGAASVSGKYLDWQTRSGLGGKPPASTGVDYQTDSWAVGGWGT